MNIEISQREIDVLLEVVASAERELIGEISRTDTREYRDKLEDKLSLLETARSRLAGGAVHDRPGR
jgi:flagellar motor switch protein FliM